MSPVEHHQVCDLSVVIPFYNEQDNLVPLWHEIRAAVEPMGLSFEVIFVDDGSSDAGPQRLQELCGSEPRVKLARLGRNCGQTAAMSAGIELAGGRIIVPMDADRQNDPASIPDLVNELTKGYDVVSGWRKRRQDGALMRRLPSKLANRLISRVTGVRLHDYGCSMKAYRAEFIRDVRLFGQMHRFIPVYCAALGARIGEIVVRHRPRIAGRSKYGIDRTWRVLLDLLVVQMLHQYRGRPMHLFGRFALWLLVLGVAMLGAGLAAGVLGGDWGLSLIVGSVGVGVGGLGVVAVLGGLLAELQMRTYYQALGERPYRIAALVNFAESTASGPAPATVGKIHA